MTDPVILIHWLFCSLALVLIGFRLAAKKLVRQRLDLGDYLSIAAAVCVLAKAGVTYTTLVWHTNVINTEWESPVLTPGEIHRREVGSKLVLVDRVLYNSYLWIQKIVLLDVYRRLMAGLRWEKVTMWLSIATLAATYVVTIVVTFTECRPFRLYWQAVPSPENCAEAPMQLIAVGCLNIITDVMLLGLPIPVLFTWSAPWQRKIKVYVVFALGMFIIAITLIRLPLNSAHIDSPSVRTTWISTEMLAAAIVVNAPTLFGLYNRRKRATQTSSEGLSGVFRPKATTPVQSAGEEAYRMGSKIRSSIIHTKQAIISEHGETGNRRWVNLPDGEEASVHSSQQGIIP